MIALTFFGCNLNSLITIKPMAKPILKQIPRINPRIRPSISSTRMVDIASAAGVSLMTVSRALKPNTSVSAATRARVLAVVKRLGYVPDSIAAGLAARRSGFVSLLMPSLNNSHFAETAMAIKETLEPHGLQLLLGHTNYQTQFEERLVQTMLSRRPEAIVLTYDGHSPHTRALLKSAGIPVIDIWEIPTRPIGHAVGFSNRAASRALAQRLIEQGYRRIAYIGETHDEGTRGTLRRLGFIDAMAAAGLAFNRQIAQAPPPINMEQGGNALAALLEKWPDTDAVMCVSDPCAYGVLIECQRRKIKVPNQLAIAGFGAFEISANCLPQLSTVQVCGRSLGLATGQLLLKLLQKNHPIEFNANQKHQTVLIDAKPVIRGSTPSRIK